MWWYGSRMFKTLACWNVPGSCVRNVAGKDSGNISFTGHVGFTFNFDSVSHASINNIKWWESQLQDSFLFCNGGGCDRDFLGHRGQAFWKHWLWRNGCRLRNMLFLDPFPSNIPHWNLKSYFFVNLFHSHIWLSCVFFAGLDWQPSQVFPGSPEHRTNPDSSWRGRYFLAILLGNFQILGTPPCQKYTNQSWRVLGDFSETSQPKTKSLVVTVPFVKVRGCSGYEDV